MLNSCFRNWNCTKVGNVATATERFTGAESRSRIANTAAARSDSARTMTTSSIMVRRGSVGAGGCGGAGVTRPVCGADQLPGVTVSTARQQYQAAVLRYGRN